MKYPFLPTSLLLLCLPYTYYPISHQRLYLIHSWILLGFLLLPSILTATPWLGFLQSLLAGISGFILLSSLHIIIGGISLKTTNLCHSSPHKSLQCPSEYISNLLAQLIKSLSFVCVYLSRDAVFLVFILLRVSEISLSKRQHWFVLLIRYLFTNFFGFVFYELSFISNFFLFFPLLSFLI